VPILQDAATFRKFIVNQSSSQSSDRFKHLRMLLQAICLRRTREVIGLSDAVPELRYINLTPEERNEYNQIIHSCRINIERVVSRRGKNVNSTVLESLLRLRLFCNNGTPETDCSTDASDHDEILSYLQQVNQAICAYCAETVYTIDSASDTDGGTLMSKCYHLACRECLQRYYDDRKRCPKCHNQNTDPDIAEAIRKLREKNTPTQGVIHNAVYSSKLTALMEDLWSHSQRKRYFRSKLIIED
jgi:SWI/SNF-related matrix-associated actin-dependent regulator of chromatin subfamily A3